jgi:hypothetical protein
MRKIVLVFALFGVLSFLTTNHAQATLIDRGNGLIYDTVLDITWLQDANYAFNSGQDSDGLFNWMDANTWAANLDYQNYDDWRLPSMDVNGDTAVVSLNSCASSEAACQDNEYAYMHSYNLNGGSGVDRSGNRVGDGGVTLFNIQNTYWSSTPAGTGAWNFSFFLGGQNVVPQENLRAAWAVRDGDVASVPEPATALLMAIGLGAIWMVRLRKK